MHDDMGQRETGRSGRAIHLVGSVPLGSAEEVFRMCAATLGPRARRLTDGETGERSNWIRWQRPVFEATPGIEAVPPTDGGAGVSFRLRPGHVGEIRFGRLGYADAALRSWQDFQRLQAEGLIGAEQRFQVSLPTPVAVIGRFVDLQSQAALERSYEAALHAELQEIQAGIPYDRLAIQWDVAIEIAILEGVLPIHFDDPFAGIVERLQRLARWIEPSVELGLHLCYGDAGHKHFKEPADTELVVRIANAVAAGDRRLDWVHIPVPKDRHDPAYFEPLAQLALPPACTLFLGLVHDTDGLDGTKRRLEVAARYAPADFGIATECGFGRRDPGTVPGLLQLHVEI
jgi:hypothetical protein